MYFKMRVFIFSGGLGPTFVARILPFSESLRKHGIESKIILPIEWQAIATEKLGNVLSTILAHSPKDYATALGNSPDIVIIGRVSSPQIYLLQKLLKMKKVKIIFDIDDPLFLPTGKLFGINIRPGSFCLEGVIRNADFVTVNGQYLLNYVRLFNKNASVIHDPVNTSLFSPKSRRNHKIVIGWEGVPHHHYENLSLLINPLRKLAKKYDLKFNIVSYLGDPKVKHMFKNLEDFLEIDYGLRYWVPITQLSVLMSEFDIMVVPLQNKNWYEGKSALKVGMAMGMGIPVVASPVGEQKYMVKNYINGFLPKTEDDWYRYLSILIEDRELRQKMGKSGRKITINKLSSEVCGQKLHDIIQTVMCC